MKNLIILCLFLTPLSALANELAYVKTDSPRDTMETFITAMNDYRLGVLENDTQKQNRIYDAIRCFSEKNTNVIISQREKELAAIFLKEVIDRVIVIDFQLIPHNDAGTRWRLKNTELVLKPETSGEREGEWLITEGTWKRANLFYQRVRHLPYLPESGLGASYIQPWMENYLPEWSKKETLKLKNWQWLGILFGLFVGLLLRFLTSILLGLYKNLGLHRESSWRKRLLEQIERPLALLVAAFFWYGWIHYLKLEGLSFSIVNGLIQIVFGVAVTWAAYQGVSVLGYVMREKALETDSTLDDQLIPFLEKALKLTIIMLGILVVLQNMGVNVFSLLAGLGLGGLAFALAAKDTAANLFGSIMILIDRPFKIGDWIKVGDVEGTVEEIGFRSTRVRTFYNSLITVPNANMANAQIDNMGERQYRRTRTILDIAYDTPVSKMQNFIEGIRSIITENSITRKDYFHVYFTGYGPSSLQIMIYFFFITNDWAEELKERQDIYMKIFDLAETQGIEFAYPTQTLYLKNGGEVTPPT
ncbi:MAG: mechanosensitive ion channel family protein [Pseudomonadota bacterium]